MTSLWTILISLVNIAVLVLFLVLAAYAVKALRIYIKKESPSQKDK